MVLDKKISICVVGRSTAGTRVVAAKSTPDFASHNVRVTDVVTGWTETRAVRNKSQEQVFAALSSIRSDLPFPLLGIHSDNGSEVHGRPPRPFLSYPWDHLHPRALWSKARGVVRSRPYHKNDNPHVEEKNNSVIRKFVGYDRHDTQEEVDLLNRLYRSLHLLVNWFLPSQKLLSKVRTGSHITKVYDQAQTLEDFRPIPPRMLLYPRDVLTRNNWTRWPREDNPWSSRNVVTTRTY